jgi:hypothetical protein
MSLNTQEFYIRKAHEADARGPFSLEQLSSLAENGQADPDTYYYEATTETWTLISANSSLMEALFPAKRSLRVKAKTAAQVTTLNTMVQNERAITVNDMLLAAEGRTEDTRDKADPAEAQARAAGIGLYAALAILIVTSAAYILPGIDLLLAADWPALLRAPLPFFGIINLALAICLGLGAVGAYPTVRFAAMLGFGFTGTIFYLQGQSSLFGMSAAIGAGLYFSTVFVNLPGVLFAGLGGLGGAVALAYHLFTT